LCRPVAAVPADTVETSDGARRVEDVGDLLEPREIHRDLVGAGAPDRSLELGAEVGQRRAEVGGVGLVAHAFRDGGTRRGRGRAQRLDEAVVAAIVAPHRHDGGRAVAEREICGRTRFDPVGRHKAEDVVVGQGK
jgi:hypothetical protein